MLKFGIGVTTAECPILPLSPDGVARVLTSKGIDLSMIPPAELPYVPIYSDADSPGGNFVTRLQQALKAKGAKTHTGEDLEVNGGYDLRTCGVLEEWAMTHNMYLSKLHDIAQEPVTTCEIYRSLGLPCESLVIVSGITPGASLIQQAVDRGEISLSCAGLTKKSSRTPILIGGAGISGLLLLKNYMRR